MSERKDIELRHPDEFVAVLRTRLGRRTKLPTNPETLPPELYAALDARVDEYIAHIRAGTQFPRSRGSLAASRRLPR